MIDTEIDFIALIAVTNPREKPTQSRKSAKKKLRIKNTKNAMIKQGDVFLHPTRNKKCFVTRFYSNTRWYFKFLGTDSDKEILSTFSADSVSPIALQMKMEEYEPRKAGEKVKINTKELKKSPFSYTDAFLSFVENNKDTVFTVKSENSHIVSLQETPFTFWEKYLIKI